MSIVERVKRITLRPQAEWPVIAAEPASASGLFRNYIVPLAAIGPIALVIGLSIVGVTLPFVGTYRAPLTASLSQAIFSFVMILAGVGVMSVIASAIAPSFGGRADRLAALKLVGYSYTPAFIAGIIGLVPQLGILELVAAIWTLYVFYRGAPALALSTRDKAGPFTAVCVACGVVLGIAIVSTGSALGMTAGAFPRHDVAMASDTDKGRSIAAGMIGAVMGGGQTNADRAAKVAAELASSSHEIQRAEQSGDDTAQMQAGIKAIGTILHAGAAPVTPIAHADLKALLPAGVGGFKRTSAKGSSGSFAGISASSANATYGQPTSGTIEITLADLGNMSGVAIAANLATTMHVESDSDEGYEKNVDVDGHRVHEHWTNAGRQSDVTEIVDNRYAIHVEGAGVDMDAAIAALRSVDMAKFQALGHP